MATKLRMSSKQHGELHAHLLPGDGLEAAAILLCGRGADQDELVLVCREIVCIPHDDCRRGPERIHWQTTSILPSLVRATRQGLSVIKIHSHPGGFDRFSRLDDDSDRRLFQSLHGWSDEDKTHGSAIMQPDGCVRARLVHMDGTFSPLDRVVVVGDDLRIFWATESAHPPAEFTQRHAQVFGSRTTSTLQMLSAAVVGCSGTGSPVVEQLARLGIGRLVLIDPDHVEPVNLNRILNATEDDAESGTLKVHVLARAVQRMGTGTHVVAWPLNICSPEAVRVVAGCDVVFGCMDGVEGRHVLNRLAAFYSLPYFDVGVRIDADGSGGVSSLWGTVHYLQPGRSSLLSRGVYSLEDYRAEALRRVDIPAYERLLQEKYIKGAQEAQPAVIAINMQIASVAVLEFLARLHPYRYEENSRYAVTRVSLSDMTIYNEPESEPCPVFARHVGRGDADPLLDMPELSVMDGVH